jgi:hypothetical protein
MAIGTTRSSDREGTNPEPGPQPGGRAEQRGTAEQLDSAAAPGDPAVDWERDEQERLPPRGAGSQANQGTGKPTSAGRADEKPVDDSSAPGSSEGEQSGGTRGPSRSPGN